MACKNAFAPSLEIGRLLVYLSVAAWAIICSGSFVGWLKRFLQKRLIDASC